MEKDLLGASQLAPDCPTIRIVERIVSKIALNVSWQSPIERRKSRRHISE